MTRMPVSQQEIRFSVAEIFRRIKHKVVKFEIKTKQTDEDLKPLFTKQHVPKHYVVVVNDSEDCYYH